MQQFNILHRDFKPGNVFIKTRKPIESKENADIYDINNLIFKIGDFGISKRLGTQSYETTAKGTINYMAPEVYDNQKYDLKADIFSIGVTMYDCAYKIEYN